jgi:alginate O-acetyltransferase complex protein AlgI
MLFNSIGFAIFLPIVFILYWYVTGKNLIIQNTFFLFASYFFYARWDWRFLFLLVIISVCNYFIGIRIDNSVTGRKRKIWLITALISGFLEYLNIITFL